MEFLRRSPEVPFDDGSLDLVISNGVLNLVPDRRAAFPQGAAASPDLLVTGQSRLSSWQTWTGGLRELRELFRAGPACRT